MRIHPLQLFPEPMAKIACLPASQRGKAPVVRPIRDGRLAKLNALVQIRQLGIEHQIWQNAPRVQQVVDDQLT
jgi:hypothetical protein